MHSVNCVLSSQELYELLQKPMEPRVEEIQWDEEWWRELEGLCLTEYADRFMSSGGALSSIVSSLQKKYGGEVESVSDMKNDY